MYLFAAEIPEPLPEGWNASRLVRALLRHAYRRVWRESCPPLWKNADGKPYFAEAPGRFLSLSHSRTHVLAALSVGEVGADIETLRPVRAELRDYLFTPEEQRDFSFFEAWTLRESIFKLTGAGDLRTIRLALRDGEIRAPQPGVRCRIYRDIPGCAAAAACFDGNFPPEIKIVPAQEILS